MSDVACLLQSWGVIEERWLFESIEQPVPSKADALLRPYQRMWP